MAFNYRPKTKEEIEGKKKQRAFDAHLIFDYIKTNYDEGIILDPNTNFQKVKIPRAVSEKINITQLKEKLKKNGVDLKGMEITFGNGSGAGTGISAVETAQQENATRLYCETYMSKGKFPTNTELLKIYPKADDDWISTFEAQAIAIKKYIGHGKYEFSRDEGIMPHVEDVALKKCGVRTKDSWNPADIYAVKVSSKRTIMKEITDIGDLDMVESAKLDKLNDYMRTKIVSKELIGISLKKLSKGRVQTIELTNASKKEILQDISIVPNSIVLDLDLNKNDEFNTGEMSLKLQVKESVVNVQIRAFSGGVRESTQMDMTGAGAAAKLGKVSAREALDPYLKKNNLKRRMGTDLPKVGTWTEAETKKYIDEYNSIKNVLIGGESIYWGKSDWKNTIKQAINLEKDINRTASQFSSKLQCFQWVNIFRRIDEKNKLKEFLTVLYYGAKKEYETAGPFLKVA